MPDPWVKLGVRILKAVPRDDEEAVRAVHSLVWEIWRLERELLNARV